jgi:hypothetical protein
MKIVFDPSTLHQSRMGSITAVVYFEFEPTRQFPAAGWNDFVVVVAGWWIEALKQVCAGKAEAKFRFMDGPYWIGAAPQGRSLLLHCVEDRKDAGLVYEDVIQVDELRRELLTLIQSVSAACRKAGMESRDLDALRTQFPN